MTTAESIEPATGSDASLRLDSERDRQDWMTFLERLVRLDAGPVRLQATSDGATIWARPLGVLLRRDVPGRLGLPDRTVDPAQLLTGLQTGPTVALPRARDGEWRATLPPRTGWRLLDSVPTGALRGMLAQATRLVRAAPDPAAAGDSLLQQDAMTVSDERDVVTVGMRAVTVLYQLGLLALPVSDEAAPSEPAGPDRPADHVRVGVTPTWARVAARHGTIYQRREASFGLG